MARADLISFMKSQKSSPLEFNWNMLTAPNLYSLLTVQDIAQLHKIATSLKYNGNIEKKYAAIDNVLRMRGFKRLGRGTNRIVYKYMEDETFVLKVAMDRVALQDNFAEMRNQQFLKPFVTKIFQVSPCGTVAIVERVQPITSRAEFNAIAEDVFDLLVNCIIGKYVLDDIGEKCFMNYGIRCNAYGSFGPVLLDYTYVYPLDGRKLKCGAFNLSTGKVCNGEIDYDVGFNKLKCTCCGKTYLARDLQDPGKSDIKLIGKGRGVNMKIQVKRGNDVIIKSDLNSETSTIKRRGPKVEKASDNDIAVQIVRGNNSVSVGATNQSNDYKPPMSISVDIARSNNNENIQSIVPTSAEEKSNAIVNEAIEKFNAANGVPAQYIINSDGREAKVLDLPDTQEQPVNKEKPLTPEQMAIKMIEEQEKYTPSTTGEDPSKVKTNIQASIMEPFIPDNKQQVNGQSNINNKSSNFLDRL